MSNLKCFGVYQDRVEKKGNKMTLLNEFQVFNQINLSANTPLIKVPGRNYFLIKLDGPQSFSLWKPLLSIWKAQIGQAMIRMSSEDQLYHMTQLSSLTKLFCRIIKLNPHMIQLFADDEFELSSLKEGLDCLYKTLTALISFSFWGDPSQDLVKTAAMVMNAFESLC